MEEDQEDYYQQAQQSQMTQKSQKSQRFQEQDNSYNFQPEDLQVWCRKMCSFHSFTNEMLNNSRGANHTRF